MMEAAHFRSESPVFVRYDSVGSTNSVLASLGSATHGTVVIAVEQTAGRGQRGNTWEAEPGMNITMSIRLEPQGISPHDQFIISEVVALGVANILDMLAPDARISVKWPNDIYAGDRKIAGILIENTIAGRSIIASIAGIGVNVNQERFLSDAPNPVSLFQLTGIRQDIKSVAGLIASEIMSLLATYGRPDRFEELHRMYLDRLWHRTGEHDYIDTATGSRFTARIADVALTGHLTLLISPDSTPVTYAFKEVQALIPPTSKL